MRLVESVASSEKGTRDEDFDCFENRISNKLRIEKGKFGSLTKVDHLLSPLGRSSCKKLTNMGFSTTKHHNLF